jgi:hypothetical protein
LALSIRADGYARRDVATVHHDHTVVGDDVDLIGDPARDDVEHTSADRDLPLHNHALTMPFLVPVVVAAGA